MGILGTIFDFGQNMANLALQDKQYNYQKEWNQKLFDYNKQLQDTIFEREDNAVQRRVNDLREAGLSPLLASGQGAGAGSVVSQGFSGPTKAPQSMPMNFDERSRLNREQRLNAKFRTKQLENEIRGLDLRESYMKYQGDYVKAQVDNLIYQRDYAMSHNLPIGVAPNFENMAGGSVGSAVAHGVDTVAEMMSAVSPWDSNGKPRGVKDIVDSAREIIKESPVMSGIMEAMGVDLSSDSWNRALASIKTPKSKRIENQRYVDSLRRRSRGW